MARNDDRQLNLFGAPPPAAPERKRAAAVGPAPVPDSLQGLASQLPPSIRLGTSSWSFPGWEGIVYDRQVSKGQLSRRGLEAYSRHPLLRAAGIDRTYYAPIGADDFARYASQVPEDFRFLVKAAAVCTTPFARDEHGRPAGDNPHYLDPHHAEQEVVAPFVEGLGPRGGPLVFQFSPLGARQTGRPAEFAERLGRFLSALPAGPLYAVELRDRELLTAEYFAALRQAGAVHCRNVHPRMPPPERQQPADGPDDERQPLVVRWMLHGRLAYEEALQRYEPFSALVDEDPRNRDSLAALCLDRARRGLESFIIANNKAEGSAPLTVFELARRIVERHGSG